MLSLLRRIPDSGPEVECLKDLALDQIVSMPLPYGGFSRICPFGFPTAPAGPGQRDLPAGNLPGLLQLSRTALPELTQMCRDYVLLKKEWDEAVARQRSKTSAMQAISQSLDFVRDTISALEVNALYCGKIAAFPEVLLAALSKYRLQSQGLIELQEICRERLADPDYQRLRQITADLAEVAPMIGKGCEICVDIQDSLHAGEAHLAGVKSGKPEQVQRPQPLLGALFGRSAKPVEKAPEAGIALDGVSQRELVSLVNEALKETNSLLVHVTQSIYAPFANLADELWFYRFALKLKQVYEKEKVPYCFPTVKPSADDVFACEELYDLLLLVKDAERRYPLRNIVPNDARLGSATTGLLVQGANGTGKTTFLRSVGIGQILAQAGLPVPARAAVISVRRRILTQFSGEDTINGADTAGRFEGEVKEVAEIIAQLEPCSLVLFNETFQTTAFDEAAAAIFDILDVISEVNIKWVFVTHLTQLYGLLAASGRKVQFLQTSTDDKRRYQVEQIKTAGDS